MEASFRPALRVTAPSSSEELPLDHGSAGRQTTPHQPTTRPEKPSTAISGDNVRTRRHRRESKGRSRDGLFRHIMNSGSLSAYRERDDDDDGLLRPITRETTRSRWGLESTPPGPGSRRGSLLNGIDKDRPFESIKRSGKIRSMDELQQVRNQRTKGEEYLRSALSLIGTLATDITRRLDYTYYGLLEKVAALNVTISSFQELSDSTSRLLNDFQRETSGLEQDIRKQISDFKEFQPQMQRIEVLEERMRAGKTRAKALGDRLEAMRNEIEKWEKREMEWQMRTNQRLRICWCAIIVGIFAILVTAVIQNWPTAEPSSGVRIFSEAEKLTRCSSQIPPSEHNTPLVPGAPKDEYAWFPDSSNGDSCHSSPSAGPSNTPTSSEGDEVARPTTDYDPLRMLDEL